MYIVSVFLTSPYMCDYHPTFEIIKFILCFFQGILVWDGSSNEDQFKLNPG